MTPPPLFANLTYLLVAATALLAVLFRLRGGERYRLAGLFPAMGALVALGIAFRLAGWEASVSNPVLFLFWAALVGGWGLVLGRGDDPGTLSSLFRFSCLGGAVGFLLLAVGSSIDPALGAGLLLLGSLVAIAGSWVFAASGIRGARFAFAAIPAAVAGIGVLFLQPRFAEAILVVCLVLVPLAAGMRGARRKEKRLPEHHETTATGAKPWKPPVALNDDEEEEAEEVVVIRRRAGVGADAPGGEAAPVPTAQEEVPPEDPPAGKAAPPSEGEDDELATEPGRRRNVRVDPWTGAAIEDEPAEEEPEAERKSGLEEKYRLPE